MTRARGWLGPLILLLAGCHSPTAPAIQRAPKPTVYRVQALALPTLEQVSLREEGAAFVLSFHYTGSTYGLEPGQWTLQLFIDSDDADTTGYAGYERLVNGYAPVQGGLTIYDVSHTDTTGWGPVTGVAALELHPHQLSLRIPKAALNLKGGFDWELATFVDSRFTGEVVYGSGQVARVSSPRRPSGLEQVDQLGLGEVLQP